MPLLFYGWVAKIKAAFLSHFRPIGHSRLKPVYQLVDFGNGRKLERFADRLIDRPCPAAEGPEHDLPQWPQADGRFQLHKEHLGSWAFANKVPDDWNLPTVFGQMKLFPTDFGHVGVFVEQQQNWQWLHGLPLAGLKLLNLFAYTGGATLAAAAAGASVTHVDSAKNIVRRASDNARQSKLGDHSIRWIVEDAKKFVQRESKRGNCYDGIIFDPPTYGHGASSGTTWKIEDHLPTLLNGLRDVVPECRLMLFTCHSPGFTSRHMAGMVGEFRSRSTKIVHGAMDLKSLDGRTLACGNFVRWFVG